jgi:hypothetical protein
LGVFDRGEILESINERVRNVVRKTMTDTLGDAGAGGGEAGIVILGNNNVVGDNNVVVGAELAGDMSECQRYLLRQVPQMDEELVKKLCRAVQRQSEPSG